MRLLKRNTTPFEYLPNSGVDSDLNSDGEHTGEYHTVFGTAVSYRGNISAPSGQTNWTFYGLEGRYTHTLVMDNPKADIKEGGAVRWNGHLYDVIAVRPSLNVLSVALRRQTENNVPVTGVTGATGETGTTGSGNP